MAEPQTITARHGTATFVPAGQTIKIINSSGSQVIDTWAFALPKPDPKPEDGTQGQQEESGKAEKETENKDAAAQTPQSTPAKNMKQKSSLPSQEDAEQATQQGLAQAEEAGQEGQNATPQKNTWGSYVPSIPWSSKKNKDGSAQESQQQSDERQQNSKTWSSYMPSGKAFSSYVPQSASDTVSQFASTHQRDPNKSYVEQLQQFSKTPVGAAGWSGMAALTGSGYSGTMWAGYQAWNSTSAANGAQMEYLSMQHSRAATLHLRPKANDVLVTNLREPILTLIEDTSPGIHDTLMAACDPQRYRALGVDDWESHGSCAENLVLALKELNERAGLKGPQAVGAHITINSVPAPLNLFMNVPCDSDGDLGWHAPKSKGGDYVRFRAERDVVVVMSACPQDVSDVNGKAPTDAHFLVEGSLQQASQPLKKRPGPRKVASSRQASSAAKPDTAPAANAAPAKKAVPQRRPVPQRKPSTQTNQSEMTLPSQPAQRKKPAPKPVASQKKAAGTAPTQKAEGAKAAKGEKAKGGVTGADTNGTNGEAAKAPVEKKKPRKLGPSKAKPAQGAAE